MSSSISPWRSEPFPETVEHTLLLHLLEELRRSWPHSPVVVPESHLRVQLFLRDAQYRAVRVLRGYYENEDGYLMFRNSA